MPASPRRSGIKELTVNLKRNIALLKAMFGKHQCLRGWGAPFQTYSRHLGRCAGPPPLTATTPVEPPGLPPQAAAAPVEASHGRCRWLPLWFNLLGSGREQLYLATKQKLPYIYI